MLQIFKDLWLYSKVLRVVIVLSILSLVFLTISNTWLSNDILPQQKMIIDSKKECTLSYLTKNSPVEFDKQISPRFSKQYKNPCWTDAGSSKTLCIPYVWLAGFPKCGTTDMYFRLKKHPLIIAARRKEPHYITRSMMQYRYQRKRPCGQRNETSAGASCELLEYSLTFYSTASKYIGGEIDVEETTSLPSDMHFKNKDVDVEIQEIFATPAAKLTNSITIDGSASTAWDNRYWTWRGDSLGCRDVITFTPAFVKRINPGAKVIMILRDPIERGFSDYAYFKSSTTPEEFHNSTTAFINAYNKCLRQGNSVRYCTYHLQYTRVDCAREPTICYYAWARHFLSIYHVYIADWLEHFSRENLYIVRSEDYHDDIKGTLSKIFKFLDFPELSDASMTKIATLKEKNANKNRKSKLGSMWPETRKLLQDFFRPHNRRLAELLHDDNFNWD